MFTRITSSMIARSRLIILTLACAVGVGSVVSGSTLGIDKFLSELRSKTMAKAPSGSTVIVALDSRSLQELQAWPWPRSVHGRMAEQLVKLGARNIVYDVTFTTGSSDPKQDVAFAHSLSRTLGHVSLFAITDANDGHQSDKLPIPALRRYSHTATAWVRVDDKDQMHIPRTMDIAGLRVPSIASRLAGITPKTADFEPDWSIRYDTIPTYSAIDVLHGHVPAGAFRGKDVVIGAAAPAFGDQWTTPDNHRIYGVVIHALGAETLKNGVATPVSPMLAIAFAAAIVVMAGFIHSRAAANMTLAMSMPAVVAIAWLTQDQLGYAPSVASAVLVLLSTIVANIAASLAAAVMRKLTTNTDTNLPNLTAMQIGMPKGDTVVVRLQNHLDTASVLGKEGQSRLMRGIRDRMRLAAGDNRIYQVDEHSFAWRTQMDHASTTGALEGLVAVFASGINIDGRVIDTPIAAGIVNADDGLDVDVSVTAALIAAEHAARQGLPWTLHVDETVEAEWRLTMMGELELALKNGDVWVAYQPKWDAQTLRCIGSEALVRWTHPVRGPIRPDHFIPVLEETGRIDSLTAHVLDNAVADTVRLGDMTVAVNISTRMLGRGVIVQLVEKALSDHGMEPHRLTLEITESATLGGDDSIAELNALKDIGVKLSIDDYGTGQSTLTYLRKMPAYELKIDQSFIRAMATSRSDQLMIESTIVLAHQLNMKVVAEGVETAEEARMLKELACDILQGYHLGRPGKIGDLVAIVAERDRLDDESQRRKRA